MRDDKTDITLTSPISDGDKVVSVSAGHGFTATGEYMVAFENGLYFQSKVIAVATNDITVQTAISSDFSTDAVILRGVIDMDVDGSSSPQEFHCLFRGGAITPVDVQYVMITMQHLLEGDDSKFGGIAAITNGLRFLKESTFKQGLGNYLKNQDFREFGADIEYSDKAGGGAYATNVIFDIKNIYGVVIRLSPLLPECFKVIVQDDLTGLNLLHVAIMGQYTVGE